MSNSTQSSRMLSVKVNYYFLKVLLKRYNLSFSNYFKPSTLDSFSSATTLISVTFLSIVNLILFILKIWVVGDGLTKEEQMKASTGTLFIPFSQFPPKRLRKDCLYHTTPAMMPPKSFQNIDSCEVSKLMFVLIHRPQCFTYILYFMKIISLLKRS